MHNGLRPAGADLKHGPDLGQGYKPGELVMGTEEDFNARPVTARASSRSRR